MKNYLAKFNLNVYIKSGGSVSVVQSVETRLVVSETEQEAQDKLLEHFEKKNNEQVWYSLNSINVYEQIS